MGQGPVPLGISSGAMSEGDSLETGESGDLLIRIKLVPVNV